MKNYIKFGIVLFLIASISSGILSYVNNLTKPIIKERDESSEKEARKEVYINADKFEDSKAIVEGNYTFIPAYKGADFLGYVVKGIGQGYGGEISLIIGISKDGKLEGLKIISAKETPGLGDKIFNEEWQNSWKGRDKSYEFKVGIDSFAGATISPKGVYTEIMNILDIYEKKVKTNGK